MGAPSTIRNHLEEVRQLVAEGWSGASIAAKFGCAKSTTLHFIAANKLRRDKPLNATPEEIRAHKEAGRSDREIAEIYDVDPRTVFNFRVAHHIAANRGAKVGAPKTAGDAISQASREIRQIVVKGIDLAKLYGGRSYRDSSNAAQAAPRAILVNPDWEKGGRELCASPTRPQG